MSQDVMSGEDFRVFAATPGISMLLRADPPVYTVVTATDDFVRATGLSRDTVASRGLLDIFSNTALLQFAPGREMLEESLRQVIGDKTIHEIRMPGSDQAGTSGAANLRAWKMINAPVLNEAGEVDYIISTLVDVPDNSKIDSGVASISGMEKAYRFFMNAPVIIGYVRGDDYIIELANEGLLKVWEKSDDVIGRPLFQAVPELEKQGVRPLLDEVRRTGNPFFAYEHPLTFYRNGKAETLYFDFVYQPLYENEGDQIASGVISVGHDVSQQVRVRHKFRNVIDQANDPIVILMGLNMTVDIANKAFFDFCRLDRSAVGKSLFTVFPELAKQGFVAILQNVYKTGTPYQGYEVPVYIYDASGVKKIFYFNLTCQPYREPNGDTSGVLVLGSDATAQVLAQRELEASHKKWRDIANSMPVIVWTANSNGSVLFFNDQWYQFTGLTEEGSIGFGWLSVIHPEDLDRCLRIWRETTSVEGLYEIELRYKRKDGEYRWVLSRGLPIKEDSKVIAWYGTSTDIHEQKQQEADLEEKVRARTGELEEKNRLLDNILKHSSNGISVSELLVDHDGNIVDATTILANDAALKASGLPREVYLTKRATDFDPGIIASPYGQACIRTQQTGEPSVMQYFLEVTSRWLELTISKMDDQHLIHIFTDVTPIKSAQLQLEKSIEDLKYATPILKSLPTRHLTTLKNQFEKFSSLQTG